MLGRRPHRASRWCSGCWTVQRPRTTSIPESTSSSLDRESLPVRSVRSVLSSVTNWETLATDSFGSPVTVDGSGTFPGALAHFRLLVKATQTTVATRLRFSESPCTTTTGRRNAGPEPLASGRSAHQTSPWAIVTSRCASGCGETPSAGTGPPIHRSRPALGPSHRSHDQRHDGPRIQRAPDCTPRFAIASSAVQAVQPLQKGRLERTPRFSYPEYNHLLEFVNPCGQRSARDAALSFMGRLVRKTPS